MFTLPPTDEVRGQGLPVDLLRQSAKGVDEGRTDHLRGADEVEHLGPGRGNVHRLGEEVAEIVDRNVVASERGDEVVMFLLGASDPQNIVATRTVSGWDMLLLLVPHKRVVRRDQGLE